MVKEAEHYHLPSVLVFFSLEIANKKKNNKMMEDEDPNFIQANPWSLM